MTTGSVKDAGRTGRPSTSRSEENVAIVREMFNRSSAKSTLKQLAIAESRVRGTSGVAEIIELPPVETPLRAATDTRRLRLQDGV
ncbi:hypothetical protein ANN_08658 [Periplaneta americana]|uniref:Uncharacterized protein n=1 Tax=Periplaneta americana TaxID=6978 RepID=A0ABQ8T235_PERAM|nr:hypothetical protein ANN_08658 [Periplaneta americana]